MFPFDIHDIRTARLTAAAAFAVLTTFVSGCGMVGGRDVDEAAFCNFYADSIEALMTSTDLYDDQFTKALNLIKRAEEVAPDEIHTDIAAARAMFEDAREEGMTTEEVAQIETDAGAATERWAVEHCAGYSG